MGCLARKAGTHRDCWPAKRSRLLQALRITCTQWPMAHRRCSSNDKCLEKAISGACLQKVPFSSISLLSISSIWYAMLKWTRSFREIHDFANVSEPIGPRDQYCACLYCEIYIMSHTVYSMNLHTGQAWWQPQLPIFWQAVYGLDFTSKLRHPFTWIHEIITSCLDMLQSVPLSVQEYLPKTSQEASVSKYKPYMKICRFEQLSRAP